MSVREVATGLKTFTALAMFWHWASFLDCRPFWFYSWCRSFSHQQIFHDSRSLIWALKAFFVDEWMTYRLPIVSWAELHSVDCVCDASSESSEGLTETWNSAGLCNAHRGLSGSSLASFNRGTEKQHKGWNAVHALTSYSLRLWSASFQTLLMVELKLHSNRLKAF